jgi:putative tryptophan/tyrosine transport system substrate-binding protein
LPWAARTRIDETAVIDSTGIFWMEFLGRRREFITLLGGAVIAWPLAVRAQQPERMRRIGVLMAHAENDAEFHDYLSAFREGLQKLGWTEGRNIQIDSRWGALDDAEAR